MRKIYVIDRGCTLCDACFWACPQKAIYESDGRCHIDQEKCSHCGICHKGCASEAISVTEVEGTRTVKGE